MRRLSIFVLVAAAVFGCEWDYPIWIPRSTSADPLYRFVRNGKTGYINSHGKIVIPANRLAVGSNYGSEFHDGLMEVAVSSGKYVDKTGRLALDPGLYRGWDFSEGLAAAMKTDGGNWGYIDTTGKFVISPRFASNLDNYVYSFSDGLAKIEVNNRFGFIDKTGRFVIEPNLLDASGFSDGMTRIIVAGPCVYYPEGGCGAFNPQTPGVSRVHPNIRPEALGACKFTYMDKTGHIITEQRFDNGRDFSEGLAPVQVGKLWGFLDKNGRLSIEPKFEDAQPFFSGLARISKGDRYGYIDKNGQIVIAPNFAQADNFSEGLAVVSDQAEHYRYITTKGDSAFAGDFAVASSFFKGLANVRLKSTYRKKFAYIDRDGRTIFRY